MPHQPIDRLQEYVAGLSNLDLWKMWNNTDDYEAEARHIAEHEFHRRNISQDEIDAIRQHADTEREDSEELAVIPLPWGWRIFFGVIAITLLAVIVVALVASSFEASGRKRWARETWKSFIVGLLCWIALFVLLRIFSGIA